LDIMVQLATLLMDPVYTILGIIASALVIHDFFIDKRQKRVEKGVSTGIPKTDEKPTK
jgi:hypothetical protein